MAIGDIVKTYRVSRYQVEIRHQDGEWHEIHPPDWEHTTDLTVARPYADRVRADHPASGVRIIETDSVKITKLRTGEVQWMGLSSQVQTYL